MPRVQQVETAIREYDLCHLAGVSVARFRADDVYVKGYHFAILTAKPRGPWPMYFEFAAALDATSSC